MKKDTRNYGKFHPRFAEGGPVNPSDYETKLDPDEEREFDTWKSMMAPRDSGEDYDFRGAFKAGEGPDPETGHWRDTFKKPNHPTFSDQSQYAKDRPDLAGHWKDDQYIKPGGADE